MARSKKCLTCAYCCNIRGASNASWKNDYSCDYLLITGTRGNKGDDVDNCLLYKPKEEGKKMKRLY